MRVDLAKTNGSSPPSSAISANTCRIRAWFDGACEPKNPGGCATWGAIVEVDGNTVFERHGYVGVGPDMSNNVAEYCGCEAALEEIARHEGDAVIFGDSMLVIEQMNGNWRARGGSYLRFFERARDILAAVGRERVRFQWIPREENEKADQLSRLALRERGVVEAPKRRSFAKNKTTEDPKKSTYKVRKSRTSKTSSRTEKGTHAERI